MKTHIVTRLSALIYSSSLTGAGEFIVRIPPDLVRRKLYFGLAFSGITSVNNLSMELALKLDETSIVTLRDRILGEAGNRTMSSTKWNQNDLGDGNVMEGYGELPPFSVVERAFAGAVPPALDLPPAGDLTDALRFSAFNDVSAAMTTGMNRYDFMCWPRLVLARANKLSFRFTGGSVTADIVDAACTFAFIGCKSEGY